MALRLEVIIPTTRNLSKEEQEEIIFGVYYAVKDRLKTEAFDEFELGKKIIVQPIN